MQGHCWNSKHYFWDGSSQTSVYVARIFISSKYFILSLSFHNFATLDNVFCNSLRGYNCYCNMSLETISIYFVWVVSQKVMYIAYCVTLYHYQSKGNVLAWSILIWELFRYKSVSVYLNLIKQLMKSHCWTIYHAIVSSERAVMLTKLQFTSGVSKEGLGSMFLISFFFEGRKTQTPYTRIGFSEPQGSTVYFIKHLRFL